MIIPGGVIISNKEYKNTGNADFDIYSFEYNRKDSFNLDDFNKEFKVWSTRRRNIINEVKRKRRKRKLIAVFKSKAAAAVFIAFIMLAALNYTAIAHYAGELKNEIAFILSELQN